MKNLDQKINNLKEKYEYYNLFNLDKNLADVLSKIISKKENEDYDCKIIDVTRLEHNKTIYTEVINNYQYNWDDKIEEYSTTNGVETSTIQIDQAKYTFFVVYNKKYEELLNNIEFKLDDTINDYLNKITIFYDNCVNVIKIGDYDNTEKIYTIDIKKLEKKLPYLKEVFYTLNMWRYENDRTIVDREVLDDQIQKVKK